jgi:hypothetical protein
MALAKTALVRVIIVPICGMFVSQTALAVAHYNNWYPEQWTARFLMESPTLLQVEWVRWCLFTIFSLLVWAIADFWAYRRHETQATSKRMMLWAGLFAGLAIAITCGSLLYFDRSPSKKIAASKNLVWVFSGMAGKSDADGFHVSDIQFWAAKNETGRPIRIKDAYIQSGLDGGKKRPLMINTHDHGLIPVTSANPIPPGTENITLMAEFPLLAETEFMKDWGIIDFAIQDDEQTFSGRIEEKQLREIFDGYRPKTPPPRITGLANPPPPSAPLMQKKNALLKAYPKPIDRQQLDEALLKMFNVINGSGQKVYTDTRDNLLAKWQTRLMDPALGQAYFLAEIDRIRNESVKCIQALHAFIYTDYGYYRDELRDASFEGEGAPVFNQALDAFRDVIAQLPERPTLKQIQTLAIGAHSKLETAANTYAQWVGKSKEKIVMKREELGA